MAVPHLTRGKTALYIIGQPIDQISDNKLPSNGDVLRRIVSITIKKTSVREACNSVCDEICCIWKKANIPTKAKPNIVTQMVKLHDKYRTIQKSQSRQSVSQNKITDSFKESLNDLFDIAPNNALQIISVEEDRLFLAAQREKGRRGYIGVVDKESVAKETRKRKREEKIEVQKKGEQIRKEEMSATVELSSSSTNTSYDSDSDSSNIGQYTPKPSTSRTSMCAKKRIVTPDLAMALDRTKASDRNAFMVVASTVNALGVDIDDVVLSRSTLQRQRSALRKEIAEDIKQSFVTDVPLTVHWDGKLLTDITGCKNTERLPILVSAEGKSKLLSIPKLCSGKGIDIANAVIAGLEDWNLTDNIQAMCFDTTASNTGIKQGACSIIQSKLGRSFLLLACRHHINEIIISDVFTKCHGVCTGPDILLFKRFQNSWETIKKEQYETIKCDFEEKEAIIAFCKDELENKHPRKDHIELLELTITYLGDIPPKGVKFVKPGAMHRARWMSRVVYAIKMVLFQSQFKMTKQEQTGIQRFAHFAITFYVPNWFAAPWAAKAPRTDLEYLQKLQNSSENDLCAVAAKALCRHLWYLNEELVPLAFFDDEVNNDIKLQMIQALDKPATDRPTNRIIIDYEDKSVLEQTLASFISTKSRSFFEKLSLPTSFLQIDPSKWSENDDYTKAKNYVEKINVVNDNAERAVALIQSFNTHLTKNEEQLQYVLQIVEKHRDMFPNPTKSAMRQQNAPSD
jgi:hypothetical protein